MGWGYPDAPSDPTILQASRSLFASTKGERSSIAILRASPLSRRLTTKLSGPGHGPVSIGSTVIAARGRGPLQRQARGIVTPQMRLQASGK